MRRIFLSVGLLFALTIAAAAQGCGQQNPNCIVPTAPPGTSNNQAASTAFVQQLFGTAWGSFTLSPTCGTATFTSSSGQFNTVGKTTFLSIDIVFNAIGTCTNNLTFTLPNTVATNGAIAGQVASTGKGFTCALLGTSSTTSNCVHADGTNWNASEHALGSGVYQNQ